MGYFFPYFYRAMKAKIWCNVSLRLFVLHSMKVNITEFRIHSTTECPNYGHPVFFGGEPEKLG